MARLAFFGLLLFLPVATAIAQEAGPACQKELAEVDRDSVRALVGFTMAAGTAEKCIALARHIAATARARDVHLRCLPDGPDRSHIVEGLNATIVDFQQVQMQLGCRVSSWLLPLPRTDG